MRDEEKRDKVRQRYQQESAGEKVFIPAKQKEDIHAPGTVLRACAYCRVSTDNIEQLSSFELQQAHYREVSEKNPNWDLRRIYADEGISGTSLKNRDAFNEMIAACEAGEYDLIVTKSVSRFARNIVDCISLIRRLKNHVPPIGVYFEIDNLYTLSNNSEFMLSFLATFAQEESVKKSESMNWSLIQRFKSGKLLTPALLGYDRDEDGKLVINESEAVIIRFIFDAFLAGFTTHDLANLLADIGCPTKTGSTVWSEGSISYILKNERYCGSVLTWKTFTSDIFEHKKRRNRQDRDQYLYPDNHEPIISAEKYEATQILFENRKHHMRGGYPLMHVIDDGIFRGFIPINHHWVNDDPNTYFDASNAVDQDSYPRRVRRNAFSAFDLEGYQVVRGQFLSTRAFGPSLTISSRRITFNNGCVRKFHDVPYIQMLLHPTERKMAIRPCEAEDAYSVRWRLDPERPLLSKSLLCQHFVTALFQIMDWNPDYTYRIRGAWAMRGCDEIIVFHLSQAVAVITCEIAEAAHDGGDEATVRKKRMETFPEDWAVGFGMDFYDYSVQNQFRYDDMRTDWKARAKSKPIADPTLPSLLSRADVQASIADLKINTGGTDGVR